MKCMKSSTKISKFFPREMHEFSVFFSFIDSMKLQNKRASGDNPCKQHISILFQIPKSADIREIIIFANNIAYFMYLLEDNCLTSFIRLLPKFSL